MSEAQGKRIAPRSGFGSRGRSNSGQGSNEFLPDSSPNVTIMNLVQRQPLPLLM
jgi:hypothetical protein